MKYVRYFQELTKNGGLLSRHQEFNAVDDKDARQKARDFIKNNSEKESYGKLSLNGLARRHGDRFISIPT